MDLPRDGRSQVEVVVTVDGVEQYREVVDTQMQLVTVPVRVPAYRRSQSISTGRGLEPGGPL